MLGSSRQYKVAEGGCSGYVAGEATAQRLSPQGGAKRAVDGLATGTWTTAAPQDGPLHAFAASGTLRLQ